MADEKQGFIEVPATRGFVLLAILVFAYIKHTMTLPFFHGADASTFKADGLTPNTAQSPAVAASGTSPALAAGVN